MDKVYFQRWVFGKIQDVETSLKVLDGYNKTFYSRKKIKDLNLLTEAAKYAHENEMIYFITILRDDKPYCFLEINKGFFRVCFLDEYQREYLSYDFTDKYREVDSTKLFLSQILFREFQGETDKTLKTTNYKFKPDGSLVIIERDLAKNEQLNREAKEKIDITANWEEFPEFGKYDSIIRKERDIKLNNV